MLLKYYMQHLPHLHNPNIRLFDSILPHDIIPWKSQDRILVLKKSFSLFFFSSQILILLAKEFLPFSCFSQCGWLPVHAKTPLNPSLRPNMIAQRVWRSTSIQVRESNPLEQCSTHYGRLAGLFWSELFKVRSRTMNVGPSQLRQPVSLRASVPTIHIFLKTPLMIDFSSIKTSQIII